MGLQSRGSSIRLCPSNCNKWQKYEYILPQRTTLDSSLIHQQIEALPHIVTAVKGKVPVFVDGGFRESTDIFTALALGADMVSQKPFE